MVHDIGSTNLLFFKSHHIWFETPTGPGKISLGALSEVLKNAGSADASGGIHAAVDMLGVSEGAL